MFTDNVKGIFTPLRLVLILNPIHDDDDVFH